MILSELQKPAPLSAAIHLGSATGSVVPATLLGVNLEMASMVSKGMLSDRLENAKFCGPAQPQTGLAPGWQPIGNNMGNVHYQLIAGMSLSGHESQLINSYAGNGAGLIQTNRYIWEGEELEIEFWAKVRHHPVKVEFSIRPQPSRAPAYSSAHVTIDAAYWKRYTATLNAPCDDAETTFMAILMDRGVVIFDQIHLRPKDEPHLSAATVQAMREMHLSLIRFPGGCMSTNHRWKLGTGPLHLRPSLPDPVFKSRADYDFGHEEYLAICHAQAIRPYITLNIGSEPLEGIADLVAYCAEWHRSRDLELPEIYFQVGNEQYGIWETAHMNATMFLNVVRAVVPVVRQHYPKAIIVGPAEPFCSGIAGFEQTPLRELMLSEARGLIDVFAINRYKGQWYTDPAEQVLNAVESVDKIEADFIQLREDCERHGIEPRLALPEWNYWLHASHWDGKDFYEPDDALHALFVSGMIQMMARMAPFIELAAYEHLVNAMGLIYNRGGRIYQTAISRIFQLYREALPGERITLETDSAELASGMPQLDALAIGHDRGVWLFVCNRSWDREMPLEIKGVEGCLTEVILMASDDCHEPMRERKAERPLLLPPLSLARLRYEG